MKSYTNFKKICKGLSIIGLTLLASACGNEMLPGTESSTENGDATGITLRAGIDTDAATRAGGDKQIPAGYRLRCILKAYAYVDGQTAKQPVGGTTKYITTAEEAFNANGFDIPIHLPAGKYTAVCWADYIETGSEADVCYDTTDGLTAIRQKAADLDDKYATSIAGGSNIEDGYAGRTETFTISIDGTVTGSLAFTMRRPMVKMTVENIKLVDKDGNEYTSPTTQSAKIAYSASQNAGDTYNALTGAVSGTLRDSFAKSVDISGVFSLHQYLFVPENKDAVGSLSFHIETGDAVTYKRGDAANKELQVHLNRQNCNMTVKGENGSLTFKQQQQQQETL